MSLFEHLKRAPPVEPLPDEQVAGAYRRYRIRVFVAVYLGYSLYYIVRKNIAAASEKAHFRCRLPIFFPELP